MTKIKICGLSRVEDIAAVNEICPDYIGFVFATSKRQVSPFEAAELRARLAGNIRVCGVFVDASIGEITKLVHTGVIDMVQLHGDEDEIYINQCKVENGAPVIKAVRVQSEQDILRAQELPCDYLLLDAYNKEIKGGTGESFDWRMIPAIKKPFFLAGGIDKDNIEKAIDTCHPYCVDVSSGAEVDGRKDRELMEEIVRKVRAHV